jgi:PLP dependent protein
LSFAVPERLAALRERIASTGVDPSTITIVAITKTFGPDAIAAAGDAGLTDIGENYAQELLAKLPHVAPGAHPFRMRVHFTGRLQSNKINALAPVIDLWQTVDRVSLADALGRRAGGAAVLVQVNVSDEPSKGGCAPEDTAALVAHCQAVGLRVDGLMTVGRTGAPRDTAAVFALARRQCDELGLAVCSMGMSDDLEVAVAEGSTMIRVGTALFGSRS